MTADRPDGASAEQDSKDGGRRDGLGSIFGLFFRLGLTAFGGPAAHIAILEDEVVTRRRWMERQHFVDLIGATSLLPGPNSTEMVLHAGFERRGIGGLLAAGLGFLLPAAGMTCGLAALYVAFGSLPRIEPFLAGVKPVVVVLIGLALYRLGPKAIGGWKTAVIAAATAAAVVAGVSEVVAILAGGLLGMLWLRFTAPPPAAAAALAPPALGPLELAGASASPLPAAATAAGATGAAAAAGAAGLASVPLWKLGLIFLKVGAVLYGSGYVLFAFLEGELVQARGWLTEDQLLDAIAVGQLTPGPVLTTATFVGYLLAGLPGAGVATLGIFLPAFVLIPLVNPVIPKLRRSPWASAFLDAVNAASIALMAVVTVELAAASLRTPLAWAIAAAAALAALRFKVGAPWLVLGGALVGAVAAFLAG